MKNNVLGHNHKPTMSIAKTLQSVYSLMGSPGTQNIRNPFPLHKLVVAILPTAKSQGMTTEEILLRLREQNFIVRKPTLHSILTKMNCNGSIQLTTRLEMTERRAAKLPRYSHGTYHFAL